MNGSDNDLLICGRCQYQFKDVKSFINHKNNECLRTYDDTYNTPMKYEDHSKTLLQYHEKESYEPYNNVVPNNNYYQDMTNISCMYNSDKPVDPKTNITTLDYGSRWPTAYYTSCTEDLMLNSSKEDVFDGNQVSEMNYDLFPISDSINVDNEGYIESYPETVHKNIPSKVEFQSGQHLYQVNQSDNYLSSLSVDLDNCKEQDYYHYNAEQKSYNYYRKNDPYKQYPVNCSNYGNAANVSDPNSISKPTDNPPKIDSTKIDRSKPTRKFSCNICSKIFLRHSNLQQHMRLHTGEKPFQCPICGRKFTQKSNAKKHIQSHKIWSIGNEMAASNLSVVDVNLKDNRKVILRPSKSLSCVIEKKQFQLLPGSNNGRLFSSNNNNNSIRNNNGNGSHPLLVVSNSFECKFCKQTFSTYLQLKSHSVKHKDQQIFLCLFADCKQTFKELEELLKHLESHDKIDNSLLTCQYCNVTLPNLYEYRCHIKHNHKNRKELDRTDDQTSEENGKWVYCLICPEIFKNNRLLNRHIRLKHKNDLLFKCSSCNKYFRTMASLKIHKVQHKMLNQEQQETYYNLPSHNSYRYNNKINTRNVDKSRTKLIISDSSSTISTVSIMPNPYNDPIHDKRTYHDSVSHHSTESYGTSHLNNGDNLVCFCCGKLYRRRQPFESHVLLCKQKELEKERRENYRSQKSLRQSSSLPSMRYFQQPPPPPDDSALNVELSRSSRRCKFQKTWTNKPTRRKRQKVSQADNHVSVNKSTVPPQTTSFYTVLDDGVVMPNITCTNINSTSPSYTLPGIEVLNRYYHHNQPAQQSQISYSTSTNNHYTATPVNETFSYLKSLEFNP